MCLRGGGGGRRHLPAEGASILGGFPVARDPTGARNWALAGNNKIQVQFGNARPSSILVFLSCKPISIFSFPFPLPLRTAPKCRSKERRGTQASCLLRGPPAAGKAATMPQKSEAGAPSSYNFRTAGFPSELNDR